MTTSGLDYDHDNPYRSPRETISSQHIGIVVGRGWLYRKVRLPEPVDATIEYSGRGFGFETVRVDGEIVARKMSLLWFVPHFDFSFRTKSGMLQASIDVRVAPWFVLSSIVIQVEGTVVYAEI